MKVCFFEIAQLEIDEAIEYYNYQSPGLGNEFLAEVLHAIGRIAQYAEAWHRLFMKFVRKAFWLWQWPICIAILRTGKSETKGSEIMAQARACVGLTPNLYIFSKSPPDK